MAYNVLKGKVEGSVDQHADQEIGGVKVFKNTISASIFYDTDAQSPCATMKDVAITKIVGGTQGSILTIQGNKVAQGSHNLLFDGDTLSVKNIRAGKLKGSGEELSNVPVDQFSGVIEAEFIKYGAGLQSVRGTLQPKTTQGIVVTEEGLSIGLSSTGGLSILGKSLVIDPAKADNITTAGQNLSDADILLISDVSRGSVHKTTLSNLYDNYINLKIPQPAGEINAIQLKGRKGFDATKKLTYDSACNTLKVEGIISATSLNIEDKLTCGGAVINNIGKVKSKTYEVKPADYTILCDTIDNPISVIVPPACNHSGRTLIIKKANSNKYNLRSYPVVIKTLEGTIDINDEVVLKTNYSSRTLQSDGENWWVIGTKGN